MFVEIPFLLSCNLPATVLNTDPSAAGPVKAELKPDTFYHDPTKKRGFGGISTVKKSPTLLIS